MQSENSFKLDLLHLLKVGYFELRKLRKMMETSLHVVLKIVWKTHSRYSSILSTEQISVACKFTNTAAII